MKCELTVSVRIDENVHSTLTRYLNMFLISALFRLSIDTKMVFPVRPLSCSCFVLLQAVRFLVYIAVLGDCGGDKSLKSETLELKVICYKTSFFRSIICFKWYIQFRKILKQRGLLTTLNKPLATSVDKPVQCDVM